MSHALSSFPLADADKCVKCALCLPHCPTYRLTLDEGESPRGRIALMQGMASGALKVTPHFTAHLDHCLSCRACEAVCPAEVPYGRLIDAARAEMRRQGSAEAWQARGFAFVMRSTQLRRLLHGSLWLAEALYLIPLARRLHGLGSANLRRQLEMLPKVVFPHRRQTRYPADTQKTDVLLFTGCIADITNPQTSTAAIQLLNALSVGVMVPAAQQCCGALDQHAGRAQKAAESARQNLAAFSGDAVIVGTASGCLATLKEYQEVRPGAEAKQFAARVQDICSYVAGQAGLTKIAFKPWPVRAVLHAPCTLRNVLKTDKAVLPLLKLVPELQVDVLPASTGCCGAAGSYVLTQAQEADAFAEQIVETMQKRAAAPELLITSNIGCALHLKAALARRGIHIPVLHPIEVLARQLPDATRH
jgi:glycolate oxidase iron-sulfur subunit